MTRFLPFLLFLPLTTAFAQTDSVVVSGQIKRLSARLYRQSPNVVVARTNVVRGGNEQAFLAPLQPDGRFRVAVPIIYPLEEMTAQIGPKSVAFLAAAGQVSIETDDDSLLVAAVPFRFGGVNAQVNQQHAQFRAFDLKQQAAQKNERDRAIRRALTVGTFEGTYQALLGTFNAFTEQRETYPLVRDWVRANARHEAAALLFDKALSTEQSLSRELVKQLITGNDNLLTPARANALSRFGAYASQQVAQQAAGSNRGVKVRLLASVLDRYGRNLTDDDRQRLATMRETGSARTVELRYLSKLMERNADTINRIMMYENAIQAVRPLFDSSAVDYVKAYALTSVVPQIPLSMVQLFSQHIRPQIGQAPFRQSFDEVVSLALRDTALVRQTRAVYLEQEKKRGINYGPLGNSIYATTGSFQEGDVLVKNALDRNRGKVVYVVLWSPAQENGRQLARDAQRLLDVFDTRDVALLYVSLNDADETLWLESVCRNRLRGDHLRLSNSQTDEAVSALNLYDESPVRLFTPQGKQARREALLPGGESPDEFGKLVEQIRELLR